MLIERAVNCGIIPSYLLFDSWYAWPVLINPIRSLKDKSIHVICRLKNNKVKYEYNGKAYQLCDLYQRVKRRLKKDQRTGLVMSQIIVRCK
jgi:hypothetical protein